MSHLADLSILVVEDEPMLRSAILESLKRVGCKLLEAPDGNVAFDLVRKEKVDLILSDVRMPHCDGIELIKKINTLDENVRPTIALVTGYSDLGEDEALKLGAFAVLYKPFSKNKLLELIQHFYQVKKSS